jgi:hypothetical protein
LYGENGVVLTRETLFIRAPLMQAGQPMSAPQNAPTAQINAIAPIQQGGSVRESLPEIRALRDAMRLFEEMGIAPGGRQKEEPTPDELFAKMLVQSPDVVKEKLRQFMNPASGAIETEPAPWWMALVERAAPSLLQIAETVATAYAQSVVSAPPVRARYPAAVPSPAPPPTAPPPLTETDMTIPQTVQEMQEFFVTCLADGVPPADCADVLQRFLRAKPFYRVIFRPYLAIEPAQAIEKIVAACDWENAPDGAEDWIRSLQNLMKG